MITVRCQKSGPNRASRTQNVPAKKQRQREEMIQGIRVGFDTVISHACADMEESMLSVPNLKQNLKSSDMSDDIKTLLPSSAVKQWDV